jgi:3'-5' exoribonuclease
MDKIWVKDVKEGERVKSTFLVARKALPTAKSGKPYLSVTLTDKTGELEARAFERLEELGAVFEERDHVEVEGPVGTFQGRPQLKIEAVAKVDPATLDAAEFAWVPPPEPKKPERQGFSDQDEQLWKELLALVEAVVDGNVKALVKAFLEDEDVVQRLRRAPAAKTVHHAYAGGLLEHTVSCLKLAHRVADHYPQVDRDLLVAGAFFHDLGKIRELGYGTGQTEYTDEGRLVGHLVMTAQWVHDKARRVGVPRDLEHHVVHLVLSHHGRLEFGSPKTPMTLEALLTHAIDELDSRVNSWLNLMGGEGGTKRWTDAQNVYEQHIWRGTLPTAQSEKKGPPPEVLTPVIYVPREASPQARSQDRNRKRPRPERRPEPRAEHRAEAPPAGAAHDAPRPEGEAAARPEHPPRPERPERPERPPRPDRPDRGPRGPGGPGGPGDRQKRYMGPRLPGDTGPKPRQDKGKPSSLTHNPFAALAQKLEEGGKAAGEAEQQAEPAAPPEAAAAQPSAPVEGGPAPAAPEGGAAPAAEPAPGGDQGSGTGSGQP